MFRVAILGRPNVGKSTLFNRLVGRRDAIVHDLPGVTRDRKYGLASIGPLEFEVVDTPGLEDLGKQTLAGRMSGQSMEALKGAHVLLFVVDARAGVTGEDEHFARVLRATGMPIILVANKAESSAIVQAGLYDIMRLGLGEPVPVSAEHGEGLGNLYDALAPFEQAVPEQDESNKPIRLVILGRPNAGKSTLVNTLAGEERVLTGAEAGITRDAVEVRIVWKGRDYRIMDTAGMRRKAKVQEDLEYLSVGSSLNALKYAEVVILMLDATIPLEKQDNTIAGLIEREGRGCVIALNKSDEIKVNEAYLKAFYHRLHDVVPQMKDIPVVPIIATTGKGVDELMQAVNDIHDTWNKRIPTHKLNVWLEEMVSAHSPPLVRGRRLKFRYITQTKTRPPTFALFSNMNKEVPDSYVRYLTNDLRSTFDMPGVPIRLMLRTGKNPYVKKEK
jgi:GTPase